MTFRFFTFFFKNNNKTSQLHPSHHSLFPNLHSLKPHSLWLSWLLQAHIFLKAIGKEIKTSQNMPAIPCRMTSALLSVSLLSDLPEVTSVIPSKTFIVFMNWPITTRTPTLLWPFVFYLECVTPWLWIRLCPCLVCGTYSFTNKITVRCIKKSFYPFYACSVFMLGKRKTNKQKARQTFFLWGHFSFWKLCKWGQIGWMVGVKRSKDGDFGVKRAKLKCLPGWLFLSNHVKFLGIFRDIDSCS